MGPRLSEIETDLYRELKQQSGAEEVYSQEFDDSEIKANLHKARPNTTETEWQEIQLIYNRDRPGGSFMKADQAHGRLGLNGPAARTLASDAT